MAGRAGRADALFSETRPRRPWSRRASRAGLAAGAIRPLVEPRLSLPPSVAALVLNPLYGSVDEVDQAYEIYRVRKVYI